MFEWSIDEFIASKQREQADTLLDEICAVCSPQYSDEIDKLFGKVTYSYLEDFHKLVKDEFKEKICIAAIPRVSSSFAAHRDLKCGFNALDKSWKDPLPYVEHSFSEDYVISHGKSFQHCYFFFFTQYHEFKASEECVTYYLKRVNKLKAFL